MHQPINIFWFRRDLRLNDNAALYHALKSNVPVLPIFIFDTEILNKLSNKQDARVNFIYNQLKSIQTALNSLGSDLLVLHGKPFDIFNDILHHYQIKHVFTNLDYEPYAKERDQNIGDFLLKNDAVLYTFKDQSLFDTNEILKDDGKPYTVFTPYSKKWKAKLNSYYLKPYNTNKYFGNFLKIEPKPMLRLNAIGFAESAIKIPDAKVTKAKLKEYKETRNFPALDNTSRLSVHFRFGTISIREKANIALQASETWLNELIWRDFYMQILYHFPHVAQSAFKPAYNFIEWRNNEEEFNHWCNGQTGYPIVDAGMRELNQTGFMHNRVRMIVSSFLTKHLLIDWRWGEAYFAEKLLDFDLSANNGGWQWAAGSGTDAAPYFRIFNPEIQTNKFDKNYVYIKKWVPEFGSTKYPKPIVEHHFARNRCLEVYKKGLARN